MLSYIAAGLIEGDSLPQTAADKPEIDKIFALIYITIGAIGLLLIVIAGLRYVMAQGDPGKITIAKNMIMYTAIGIIIAGSAAAIVQFVLGATS